MTPIISPYSSRPYSSANALKMKLPTIFVVKLGIEYEIIRTTSV